MLPGLNCNRCGESTCLAFAVRLILGERDIEQCTPLFAAENKKLRGVMLDLISALGYGRRAQSIVP